MSDLYNTTLDLLRRVDDDVILSVATRDMDMDSYRSCLCAWVIREKLARMTGLSDADEAYDELRMNGWPGTAGRCAELFGGSVLDWSEVFYGVCEVSGLGYVESAFVQRVDEAVRA